MIIKKTCVRTVIITLGFVLMTFRFTYAQNARQIAQNVFPSVLMLIMEDADSQPISIGSGFFIQQDIVVTNLHVIRGASKGWAKPVGKEAKFNIVGIVGVDEVRDLVLLAVSDVKSPSLILGDSHGIAVGDQVYVVGSPQGLEGTFSEGIVSGIRKMDTDSLFQITAPISAGSSGGPVLNSQGKLIGVAVATIKDGQNLNFAIPAHYIETLLTNKKPATPFSSEAYRELKDSILGDFEEPFKYINFVIAATIVLYEFTEEQLLAIRDAQYFLKRANEAWENVAKEKEAALDSGVGSYIKRADERYFYAKLDLDSAGLVCKFINEFGGKKGDIDTIVNLYPLINPNHEQIYISILDDKIKSFIEYFKSISPAQREVFLNFKNKELYDFSSSYHRKAEILISKLEDWSKKLKPFVHKKDDKIIMWSLFEKE